MKVLLLFSPQFLPISPFAGTAYLAGYLKNKNISVFQKDLNVEFYDYLLSPKCLKLLEKIVKGRIENAGNCNELGTLANYLLKIQKICSLVDEAKASVKNLNTFVNPYLFSHNVEVIKDVFELISEISAPTRIKLSDFSMAGNGERDDIIRFIKNERMSGIFINFLKKRIKEYISKYRPDIVGISVGDGLELSLLIAALIKKNYPEILIVLGGPGVTVAKDRIKSKEEYFDLFDFLIIHDGETAFYELIKAIKYEKSLWKVPNLLFRDKKTGQIIETKIQLHDIKQVPPPDYDGLPFDLYLAPRTIFSIQAGRGCYWNKCTFCDRPVVFSRGSYGCYRQKPVKQVIKEIITLQKKYAAEYIYFADEALPAEYLESMGRALIRNKISIKWMGLVRFDDGFREKTFQIIKKAGCVKLGVAVESASRRVLKLINKGINLDKVKKIIKWTYKYKIPLHLWWMIGLPTETKKEIKATFDYFKKLIPYLDIPGFSFQISDFLLDYYSIMNLQKRKYGILRRQSNPKNLNHYYKYFYDIQGRMSTKIKKIAYKYMLDIKKIMRHPEYVSDEYISGFLWGMFMSGRKVKPDVV